MSVSSLRPATLTDAAALGHIQVTSWRSAFRGIAPNHYLDHHVSAKNQTEDWKEILAGDEQIVIVAQVDDEVIGYAWAHREDDPSIKWDAELVSMHILPKYKRQGIGRRLVSAIAAELQRRNCSSIYLWVLEANHPARAFYESLGGTPAGCHQIQLGGKDLTEVAYGWKDIKTVRVHQDTSGLLP